MNNNNIITNEKERKRVFYSLIVFGIIIVFIGFLILQSYFQLNVLDFKSIRRYGKLIGQTAAYGFGLAISMYVVRRIAKLTVVNKFKKNILMVAKILREWHVPISIVAFSIILLHGYIMLSRGIFMNLRYISGILALLILAVQITSGIFRYKRVGIKFHKITGIIFIISMLIHISA